MNKIIAIVGPTAVGKTEYSIEIAKSLNGEIVSCDSMQLYKFMDIGSAKPTKFERSQVKHYLIDEIDPRESFSVAKYQSMAKAAINEIFSQEKLPIIVGGTGLYLNSLIYDMNFANTISDPDLRNKLYEIADTNGPDALHDMLAEKDPKAAKRIHPNNVKRVVRALEACSGGQTVKSFENSRTKTGDYEVILIGFTMYRPLLYDRINRRVDILMDMGLENEVKSLIDMGFTTDHISMKGIGYKELIDYFNGKYDIDTAIERIKTNTRHYAKRQMTWFKKYDNIKWFDLSGDVNKKEMTLSITEWIKKRL